MARPSRTAIYADDPTYFWKLVLRILCILLSVASIGCIGWALDHHVYSSDYYYGDYGYYGSDFFFLPWLLIPLGLSVVWNIANIATLLARNRPIHPGANVGCDLILWLMFGVAGSFAAIEGSGFIYEGQYASVNDSYDCETYQVDCTSQGDYTRVELKGIVIVVGASLSFVVLLFHFALFISACRYTHRRNHPYRSAHHARAVTEEATEIARKMIADMTGPNGGFVPINQHQQHQPLLSPQQQQQAHQHRDVDVESQRQPLDQPSHQQQQQRRRYEQLSAAGDGGDVDGSAHIPIAPPPPEIMVEGPPAVLETHPALRGGRNREGDSITYAPV